MNTLRGLIMNKRHYGNTILKLIAFITVFIAIAYFACGWFISYSLEQAPRKISRLITSLAADNKIKIAKFYIGDFKFISLRAVKSVDILFSGVIEKGGPDVRDRAFEFKAQRAILTMGSFRSRSFSLRIHGISLLLKDRGDKKLYDSSAIAEVNSVLEGDLYIPFRIDFLNRKHATEQVAELAREIRDMINTGETSLPFKFLGKTYFTIKGDLVNVEFMTVVSENKTRLVVNPDDILHVCDVLDIKLTSDEIDILAKNPLRASRLLQIRDYAIQKAIKISRGNPDISEDAYRHVLWSYLLTKAYGANFSKYVTGAHESGSVVNNTEEQRMQDFANNAAGRRYAAKGYKESEILGMMRADPSVINTPNARTKEALQN